MHRARLIPCIVPLVLACSASPDLPPEPDRAADEAQIRDVVDALSAAWEEGDGTAWGAQFAEDADFTVWFGLRLSGREEIAFGHQMIFDGFYDGTEFDLDVVKIAYPSRNVAVALLEGRVVRGEAAPDSPDPAPGSPDAAPMAVLRRIAGGWEIVAFQNTPYAVEELRENGDLARFKALARSAAGTETSR